MEQKDWTELWVWRPRFQLHPTLLWDVAVWVSFPIWKWGGELYLHSWSFGEPESFLTVVGPCPGIRIRHLYPSVCQSYTWETPRRPEAQTAFRNEFSLVL